MTRYSRELPDFLKSLEKEEADNATIRKLFLSVVSKKQKLLEANTEEIPVIFQKHSEEKATITATSLKLDKDTKEIQKLLQNLELKKQMVIEKHMGLLRQEQQVEGDVESYHRENEENSKAVALKKDELSKVIDKMTKAAQLFKKFLGLEFMKTKNDAVLIVFHSVDPHKPDNVFTCELKVVDRKYVVLGTRPDLGDTSDALDKLNSNNNLLSFLVTLRRRCQQLVSASNH